MPSAASRRDLNLSRWAEVQAQRSSMHPNLRLSPAGSICAMKRNTHCIVPEADFRLLQGEQDLSCYKASSCCCVRWLSWLCAGAHVALKVLLCYSRLMLQFNTMTAAHLFCKHCGICAFYRPRSNPDGYAGARACLA